METSIPAKEETVIELELTMAQKQYYRAILERNKDFLAKGAKKARYRRCLYSFIQFDEHYDSTPKDLQSSLFDSWS